MRYFKEIPPPPWFIRVGFWLALGLYVLAFFLPIDVARPQERGYSLFFAGIWGFVMAMWTPIYALGHGASLGDWGQVLQMWLAVTPWLANVVMWFALAHFSLGNGRQARRTAMVAVLLATCFLFVPALWYQPARIGLPASPAYYVWLGSMLCLAIFGELLARHNLRHAVPADLDAYLKLWSDDAKSSDPQISQITQIRKNTHRSSHLCNL